MNPDDLALFKPGVTRVVTPGGIRGTVEHRFWSKVAIAGPDDCWLWQACMSDNGYGFFRLDNKQWRAHRVAWQLTYGDIPEELRVLHKCDVPLCVNPNHLFLGTDTDNMHDRDAKGRQAKGERHGWYTHPEKRPRGDRNGARTHPERRVYRRGEQSPVSKLTADQVREIRARYAAGGCSYTDLGREFSISRSQIGRIVTGEFWKD